MSASGSRSFDVIIIGGGPGGYVAAIRASQLGMTVALVEREELGGVCLNWGCIPTKALLHAADLLREIRHGADFGIQAEPKVDLAAMVQRSRNVAGQLNKGVGGLLRKHKVTVIDGTARLAGEGRVQVTTADGGEEVLESDSIVLALQQKHPIYVAHEVFDNMEDMTEILDRILKQQNEEKED